MHIVVTGASGHLGSRLMSMLQGQGDRVLGTDIVPPRDPPEGWHFEKADLTDPARLQHVFQGADAVIHCASIHPWKKYTDSEYLDNNVKGTWHVYRVAADLGIAHIVLTSSIAAMGYNNVPVSSWAVTEEDEFPVTDLYGVTKRVQEDIAKAFVAGGRVRTLALRPPAFFPLPSLQTGFCLTANFARVDDIARAHVAAVRVMLGRQECPGPLQPFEAIFVTNHLPYRPEDAARLEPGKRNRGLVRQYWPEAYDALVQQGFNGVTTHALFDLGKAKRVLNWQPAFNFEQWLGTEFVRQRP